jgi:SAM-dependent methyltransferase
MEYKGLWWCTPNSERHVEIQFLSRHLIALSKDVSAFSVLDVGFAGSGYIESVIDLGNISYTGLDGNLERIKGSALEMPNESKKTYDKKKWVAILNKISYIHDNILSYESNIRYDIVMSISVIEHIVPMGYNINEGFDYYKDVKAVNQMKKLVKDGGHLILTFPCGEAKVFSKQKHELFTESDRDLMIYNGVRINKIIGNWTPIEIKYWTATKANDFKETSRETALSYKYKSPKVRTLCTMILQK